MCWSWQASLLFASFDLCCVYYLLKRNWYIDKWIASIGFLIFMQEISQFFLWFFVLNDKRSMHLDEYDGYRCSKTNQLFSSITTISVRLIPTTYSYFAHQSSLKYQSIFYMLFILAVLWFGITVFKIFAYEWLMLGLHVCSQIWFDGHIYWPRAWKGSLIGVIMYNLPIPTSFILFRPQWIVLVAFLPTTLIYITLLIYKPKTADSIWCWSGFIILLQQILIMPHVVKYVKSAMQKERETHFLFKYTRKHFIKYNI